MDSCKRSFFGFGITRIEKSYEPYRDTKIRLKVPIGLVTQFEYTRSPRIDSACTTWIIEDGAVEAKGISLGQEIDENRVFIAIEHEVLHDVIGRLVDVKTGWEFDNSIYADYQRMKMNVLTQVYNQLYISNFFLAWS